MLTHFLFPSNSQSPPDSKAGAAELFAAAESWPPACWPAGVYAAYTEANHAPGGLTRKYVLIGMYAIWNRSETLTDSFRGRWKYGIRGRTWRESTERDRAQLSGR
jgi:hypothetical protein